jgi:hypothetical protein
MSCSTDSSVNDVSPVNVWSANQVTVPPSAWAA